MHLVSSNRVLVLPILDPCKGTQLRPSCATASELKEKEKKQYIKNLCQMNKNSNGYHFSPVIKNLTSLLPSMTSPLRRNDVILRCSLTSSFFFLSSFLSSWNPPAAGHVPFPLQCLQIPASQGGVTLFLWVSIQVAELLYCKKRAHFGE